MRRQANGSYRVQHLLDESDRDGQLDPIAGWGEVTMGQVDPMGAEPFLDEVDAFLVRSDEAFHFFFGQMCAIPRVIWVAYFVEMLLEYMEVWLRKTDPEDDGMVLGR